MNKEDLIKEYHGKFRELRKIINSYDLILGSPNDEFDSLNHKILSHLYNGADFEKIKRILESELTSYYGLFSDETEADKIALEIIQWWHS